MWSDTRPASFFKKITLHSCTTVNELGSTLIEQLQLSPVWVVCKLNALKPKLNLLSLRIRLCVELSSEFEEWNVGGHDSWTSNCHIWTSDGVAISCHVQYKWTEGER
jgi:hypothetical protein